MAIQVGVPEVLFRATGVARQLKQDGRRTVRTACRFRGSWSAARLFLGVAGPRSRMARRNRKRLASPPLLPPYVRGGHRSSGQQRTTVAPGGRTGIHFQRANRAASARPGRATLSLYNKEGGGAQNHWVENGNSRKMGDVWGTWPILNHLARFSRPLSLPSDRLPSVPQHKGRAGRRKRRTRGRKNEQKVRVGIRWAARRVLAIAPSVFLDPSPLNR